MKRERYTHIQTVETKEEVRVTRIVTGPSPGVVFFSLTISLKHPGPFSYF
jgi:hypothetical protein